MVIYVLGLQLLRRPGSCIIITIAARVRHIAQERINQNEEDRCFMKCKKMQRSFFHH